MPTYSRDYGIIISGAMESAKREGLAECPVDRASFTSLVTNAAHFPLSVPPCLLPFHPLVPPPFGISCVHGKKSELGCRARPASLASNSRSCFSFSILVFLHTLGLPPMRLFVTYGPYETMIKRARARRRVSEREKERKGGERDEVSGSGQLDDGNVSPQEKVLFEARIPEEGPVGPPYY